MDHQSWIARIAAAGLFAGLMLAGSAFAQSGQAQQGGEAGGKAQAEQQETPTREDLMQTQRKLQSLQKEIGQLRQTALEENPELAAQRDELRDLIISTMQDNGHSPEEDQARMREIQGKLQSGEVEQAEKQQLVQEMRQKQQSLMRGQRQAFQNEEVQAKAKQFEQDLVAAMKELDPEAEALIQELNQTQQRMRQQMMQMRAAQQQDNS